MELVVILFLCHVILLSHATAHLTHEWTACEKNILKAVYEFSAFEKSSDLKGSQRYSTFLRNEYVTLQWK